MNAQERKLIKLFRALGDQEQQSLMLYAEFLESRAELSSPEEIHTPHDIPAKQNETVVAALRRLSKSYYMLESHSLLNHATTLMSQHVMQGRDSIEVIEELEELFKSGYEAYITEKESQEKS